VTATLIIVSGLSGLFFLTSNLSKLLVLSIQNIALFIAATFLYYTFYLSPQRFQVLYWIAGIHYSFAMISAIFILALITYQMTRRQRSKLVDVLIAPLAFFGGGLSEAACAYLLSLTFVVLVIIWRGNRQNAEWARKAYPTALLAFLFLLVSLLVLVLSPSNAARVDTLGTPPSGLWRTLFLSFQFSFETMLNLTKSQFLPYFVFLVMFMFLPIVFAQTVWRQPVSLAKIGLLIGVVLVVVWVLNSSSYAPSAYFYGTPPDPRGRSLAHFTTLTGIAVVSWLLGTAIKNRFQSKLLMSIALLGIGLNTMYTVRSIGNVYSELDGFVNRARLWDERDANIRAARAQGETRLEVLVIDMEDVNVRDIMGSSAIDSGWITTCSSRYYGLEAIRAVPP
jgi:hypothetical protein